MNPTPVGWSRISFALYYEDPKAAIDWLVKAFDFTVRSKVEGDGGSLVHSELMYGDGVIMVSQAGGAEDHPDAASRDTRYRTTPKAVNGANTQNV